MRCKVLLNFPLMESYLETIKMLTYNNSGLMNLPSSTSDSYCSYFHNYKRANLFLEEVFLFMVKNDLSFRVTNDNPYELRPKNHLKSCSLKLIENPERLKRSPDFTVTYYVNSNCAGYATYLGKTHEMICPPFQIVRELNFVEQQIYCHSIIEMVQILKLFKAKFGKKFIVVSIEYQ